jgi:hypothetical protein
MSHDDVHLISHACHMSRSPQLVWRKSGTMTSGVMAQADVANTDSPAMQIGSIRA